jgi:hypothetical protein
MYTLELKIMMIIRQTPTKNLAAYLNAIWVGIQTSVT